MGLLDDAIREHLDLKRRNGADPAELERAEREALGPVRREPEARPEEPTLAEPAVATSYDQETQSWPPPPEPAYEDEDEDVEPEPAPRRSRLSRIFGRSEEDEEDEEYLEEEEGLEDARPSAMDETVYGGATQEHVLLDEHEPAREEPVHSARHDEREPEDEDVLDQTPEFLQDTPDHDRLWFEQRPPRDFDFDG